MNAEHSAPEEEHGDLATRVDPPLAATVPCIWDNEAEKYVPVYSHRGVEIQHRIEALEAALAPFASYRPSAMEATIGSWIIRLPLNSPQPTFADFERARAALKQDETP